MTKSTFQIVQFVHPGFEYDRSKYVGGRHVRSGVMNWKRGNSRHDRKFILTRGSLFEPRTGTDHRDVALVFWGEWEGPSVFWKIDGAPGKPAPSIMHAPFRPNRVPLESVQNTDPMVFGDAFIYSNCLQDAYVSLRTLAPGSIILFGRHSRVGGFVFSLDTCLVIERVEALTPLPFEERAYGGDIVADAVLNPLYTEGAVDDFTVYFGRVRGPGDGPFSFFPGRPFDAPDPLFARPRLAPTGPLESVISPENMQGINTATVNAAERDAIWQEVASQVASHGCALGYHAATPPLLARHDAESAALREPAPLS